jgi:hypothetical protein
MQFEPYTYIQTKVRERKLKFLFFSKFKGDNFVKNQWTKTKLELDLRIVMQFEPYTYIKTKVKEHKLKISSRGITLSKNNPMMYQYTKFELNVCNPTRDNEWRPMMTE